MSEDSSSTSEAEPASPYDVLGDDGVRRLVSRFYELMDTLPEAAGIRAMHAEDLEPMIEKLAVFLIGWMGGPRNYNERFGRVVIPVAHRPFAIGPEERDAWLLCMRGAVMESALPEDFRERIMFSMAQMAEMCRTREADGTEREFGLPPHLAGR